MEQATFSEWEHDTKKRRTRREKFLAKRDGLIPWGRLERRVEPFYPKAGRGRRAYPLGTMLRVHCVQLFYNLSDPGMEDLLYEVESVRRFAGLRRTGPLPDETTILNFRHLLERHGLGERGGPLSLNFSSKLAISVGFNSLETKARLMLPSMSSRVPRLPA